MEIYLGIIALMSFITFIYYWVDKVKAEKRRWRIKEVTLLGLSLLFGSVGGIIAMYLIRHKNRHWYFVVTNFLGLAIHIYIGYYIFVTYGFIFK